VVVPTTGQTCWADIVVVVVSVVIVVWGLGCLVRITCCLDSR